MTPRKAANMDAVEQIDRARKSASAGCIFSAASGICLLIGGSYLQWGVPAAMISGGVCMLFVATFFAIAFHDLIRR